MTKKNHIVSFKKLEPELKDLVNKSYPYGFEDAIKSYTLGPDKRFYAFPLSTEDCNYLVKIDVDYDLSVTLVDDE